MFAIRHRDVLDRLAHVDEPDVLDRAKTDPALRFALEISRPENWRGSGLSPTQVLACAEEGIPVAWVPSKETLQALVAAPRGRRLGVLLAEEARILDACRSRLDECNDIELVDDRFLIGRALGAYESGHHEAAMALAVAVADELAVWAAAPRVRSFDSKEEHEEWQSRRVRRTRYQRVRDDLEALAGEQDLEPLTVMRRALTAPISRFFAPFHGVPGEPMPDTASRHATVHRPTAAHLTRTNALLAMMLATSILREQQAWCEEVR